MFFKFYVLCVTFTTDNEHVFCNHKICFTWSKRNIRRCALNKPMFAYCIVFNIHLLLVFLVSEKIGILHANLSSNNCVWSGLTLSTLFRSLKYSNVFDNRKFYVNDFLGRWYESPMGSWKYVRSGTSKRQINETSNYQYTWIGIGPKFHGN